jgi:hypothetical protein
MYIAAEPDISDFERSLSGASNIDVSDTELTIETGQNNSISPNDFTQTETTTETPTSLSTLGRTLQNAVLQIMNNKNDSQASKPFEKHRIEGAKVKEYEPAKFAQFRNEFLPSSQILKQAICDHELKPVDSAGRFGAMFFFSQDSAKSFIIKSMEHHEALTLQRQVLKNYFEYMSQNKNSLLPRIYCHFRLKIKKKVRYVYIMNNLFSGYSNISQTYDIKGSMAGRFASEHEKQDQQFKDQDVVRSKRVFSIGTKRNAIMEQLAKDGQFLRDCNVMDYSLLVGVTKDVERKMKNGNDSEWTFLPHAEGTETYSMGIIDILQDWNAKKVAAMVIKSTRNERLELSSVPPKTYHKRFVKFIDSIIV